MDGKQVLKPTAEQLSLQLFQLQKQYFKDRLLGENAQQLHQQFVADFFKVCERITLSEVIELKQLTGVVEEQVYKVNLAPPMLSMIGEISQSLHLQLSLNHEPLSSLISDQQVEHWLRKFLEMDHIFDYIKQRIEHTPQVRALCAYWINQNIEHFTPPAVQDFADRATAKLSPKLQKFLHIQQQRVEEKIEEKAAQLFQSQLLFLLSLPKEEYFSLGVMIWKRVKHKPISEFAAQSSPLDMEDLFILIYEFWKDLRHNVSVQNMVKNGIEQFYNAFAEESLYYLFQATGLTIEDIQLEAQRFAPAIIKHLEELGMLDMIINYHLKPFFEQNDVLNLLQAHLKD